MGASQVVVIPTELAAWAWDKGCDRSYVHLIGGTASPAFERGGNGTIELAYIPDDSPNADGFMVSVDLPVHERGGGESFSITAAEARALANALLATLALIPEPAVIQ